MKHENYHLGYDILRVYARFVHWLIHRRITIVGRENLPKDTPIVLAPNHQNALMDALAVLLLIPQQPVWLARADIFKTKLLTKILHFLKISPVYRIRDGKDTLDKNDAVFELAIRVLKNKKALAIFPEAQHTFKRQSRVHKKAIPRIAFMAEEREDFKLGIQVVPVGLYYDHYYKYNRELLVTFGESIAVKDYQELYAKNPAAAGIELRNDIFGHLVPLTLNIKSKTHYAEYELLREMYCNHALKKTSGTEKLIREKALISDVEQWEAAQPEEAETFFTKIGNYQRELKKSVMDDRAVASKKSLLHLIFNCFIAGLTFPLFLYGWLNHFLAFHLPSILIRKKIKDRVFWATVEYVLWLMLLPVFSLLQWALVWIFTGDFYLSLIYLITLPVFGKLALYLGGFYTLLRHQIKLSSLGARGKNLRLLRKDITDTLVQMLKP